MTRPSSRRVSAVLLALAALAPRSAAAGQGIAFEELGREFLAQHCGRKSTPGSCTLDEVLARDYVSVRLGAFDVRYPAGFLTDRKRAEELPTVALGLLDLQRHFAGWQSLPPEAVAGLDEDIGKLRDWVGSWNAAALGRVARADERDLLTALGAAEVVRGATERLRATTSGETAQVLEPQFTEAIRLVLAPTRREFMQTLGFLGLDDPSWRDEHWQEGADQWTQAWKGMTLVLALEYAPWNGSDPEFRTGMAPSRLDKDGLLQHALNQAGRALVFRVLNRSDLDQLGRAIAANLVIETAGRIAVLDGEGLIRTTGGTTQPYERFIPGGNPDGGVLPAISAAELDTLAACRWREAKGADWFVAALRSGQKDGAKAAARDRKNPQARDKTAHFELAGEDSDEDEQATWVVSAPFLGPHAHEQPYPPGAFLNDYREFYKAYQAAFCRWLRTEAVDGKAQPSRERFELLLTALGRPLSEELPAHEPLEAAVERLYGVPLSARDGSVDSLE